MHGSPSAAPARCPSGPSALAGPPSADQGSALLRETWEVLQTGIGAQKLGRLSPARGVPCDKGVRNAAPLGAQKLGRPAAPAHRPGGKSVALTDILDTPGICAESNSKGRTASNEAVPYTHLTLPTNLPV